MAANHLSEVRGSTYTVEDVQRDLSEVAKLLLSARQLLRTKIPEGSFDHVDDGIAALLEKSGWLADRAVHRMGGMPVVSAAFEDWTKSAERESA